ncbi:hypothetical protein VNI00_019097 [Paramarasmius palmivorus]|uniref:Uncharacterized protein n=1 Tax=Paramarasmius palmivorus TaxID=297713 RepID=A0AAW0AR76_9AGAR
MSTPLPTSPSALKKLEKQITQEAKSEDSTLKHAMKDLAHVEKSAAKAEKAVDKSTHALHKAVKEDAADKALNKATHHHDIAVGNCIRCREGHRRCLQQQVDARKAEVDTALLVSQPANKVREARLAEIEQAKESGNQTAGVDVA